MLPKYCTSRCSLFIQLPYKNTYFSTLWLLYNTTAVYKTG